MTRETKFGLLVGLVFICLFGVILSGRANSSVQEHAAMPIGQSQDHVTKFKAITSNVDPFGKNGAKDGAAPESALVADAKDVVPPPAEEALPAPGRLSPADVPAPKAPERGTVAFMPVTVETPSGGEHPDRAARLELPPERGVGAPGAADTPAAPASEAGRRVYVVKQGDTLIKVARQFFGKDGDRLANKIYEANKATVKDPGRLAVGQKLVIPGLPAEAPKADAPKADTPRSEPMKGSPAEPISDAVYAKAGQPPLVIPTAYHKDSPGTPAKLPPAGTVRDVTVQDLGRMFGNASDLSEQPSRPIAMYTVQAGDTFQKIAAKIYGDGNKFGRLLALKNQHLV
ncbi:MAG: LysM peptidoglycan-binding domain-containing protein, partial [Planctomycetota bacterium]|nr:LysM peptidoglycan-binding domain-containing protein [Planctomycetota bacterium]